MGPPSVRGDAVAVLAVVAEVGHPDALAEETGIEVHVDRLSGVYKNMMRGIVALVFRCHLVGGESTPTDESSAVRWMSLEEATRLMEPAYLVRLADAFDSEVSVRVHDGVEVLRDDSHRSVRDLYQT